MAEKIRRPKRPFLPVAKSNNGNNGSKNLQEAMRRRLKNTAQKAV